MRCYSCPNLCGVNRDENLGVCGVNNQLKIAKYYLHPFEEPVISFNKGSGTVFFTGCSLRCVFCQNYELSRNARGKIITPENLAEIFKTLEDIGADNINLVTPTHFTNEIIKAFEIYRPNVPVVYNTHGYETIENLKLIDKYVDIYLPDIKFFSPNVSKRYTGKSDYFEIASKAVKFMFESKKTVIDNGKMLSGVIVRHLILPLNKNDSIEILKWFKNNAVKGEYLSLMAQYTPFGDINAYPELKRKITKKEYDSVLNELFNLDIKNVFVQERESASEKFIPVWDF
ncbi:MAG: radical SAM protein [Clostridia bacterium]|nr:radical SAM protein [Clostridia bacterium]